MFILHAHFHAPCPSFISSLHGSLPMQAGEQEARMKSSRAGPPDGGYGWVVVMSAFIVMGLTAAVLKNFGLFFLDIQTHFGVPTSTTSWVTSTTIAMFHLGGKGSLYKLKVLVLTPYV